MRDICEKNEFRPNSKLTLIVENVAVIRHVKMILDKVISSAGYDYVAQMIELLFITPYHDA